MAPKMNWLQSIALGVLLLLLVDIWGAAALLLVLLLGLSCWPIPERAR